MTPDPYHTVTFHIDVHVDPEDIDNSDKRGKIIDEALEIVHGAPRFDGISAHAFEHATRRFTVTRADTDDLSGRLLTTQWYSDVAHEFEFELYNEEAHPVELIQDGETYRIGPDDVPREIYDWLSRGFEVTER